MRKILLTLAIFALPASAFAQSAPQPSPQAIIASLHGQTQEQADQLTLANAKLLDAEQQVQSLQQEVSSLKATAEKSKPVTPKTK
jgi:hypothetical protein